MNLGLIYEMFAHHYVNKKKVTKVTDLSAGKRLLILATGKSANQYWNKKKNQEQFEDCDILVMNRSIYKMEEEIFRLRPKYFAACDSIYWGNYREASVNKGLAKDTYLRTKEVLEKVDWELYLITTIHEKFDFVNENVHIIRINASAYQREDRRDYKLYKANFCSPVIFNVAQLAIYFGITFGYKQLELVGIDFDFIKNLYCDNECRVGLTAEHQYDTKGEKVVEVVFDKNKKGDINGSVLAKYLLETADTISSFAKLNLYAQEYGCKITNYSMNSLLDCYEKAPFNEE